MDSRNSWLFPLMVIAAGSVTAFGCIGIAVITGHLPLADKTAFLDQQIAPEVLEMQVPVLATKPALPTMAAVDSAGETASKAGDQRKAVPPTRTTAEPTVN